MKEQLGTFIEDLKEDRRIVSFDEVATKQAIVLRLLSILNWDTFNIDEVTPEYSISGRKVDYSLRVGGINKVFIESKKIREELENHQKQLLDYSFQEGIKLAILTNGITWWFYLPLHEGSWKQRRFYTIDVLQQETEEIVSKFIDFLSKENIVNGVAIQNAEEVYKSHKKQTILKDTLPKAWSKIISDTDEALIDLISETTEKLCGYKPNSEMVERFISENKDRLLISVVPPTRVAPPTLPKATRRPVSTPMSYTGKSYLDYQRGHTYEFENYWALAKGKQIIACRGKKFGDKVFLWGTERKKYKLSEVGLRYGSKLPPFDGSSYIADVEYIEINGHSRRLWERLYEEEEFDLWDISGGPMKYFEEKPQSCHYIAIYRVYKTDEVIRKEDALSPKHWGIYKKINEEKASKLSTSSKIPILMDEEFEKRKRNIVELATESLRTT